MPNQDYALTMARYNLWQNQNLLAAASGLPDSERKQDRGAFFGSIERTFSHLWWGDRMWMHRFVGTPQPESGISGSADLIVDWGEFVQSREVLDRFILKWAHDVTPASFKGELRWYSGALGRDIIKPWNIVVMHFFNHQTHHRGQIHAMLTAAGATPEATDIPVMPDAFSDL